MVFLRLIAGVGADVVVVVVVVSVFIDMVLSLTVGFVIAVVLVVAMVVVVIAGINPDAVDVDVLLVIKFIFFSGFEAIEIVTSLKRFKWKSNCASAEMKMDTIIDSELFSFAQKNRIKSTEIWKLTNTCIQPE